MIAAAAIAMMTAAAMPGCGDSRPNDGPLRFQSEVVRLWVDDDTLEVEGTYHMRCVPSSAPVAHLFYPYPREDALGDARTLLLECRGEQGPWQAAAFSERPPVGVRWTVPMDLGDRITLRTVYRQALHETFARYIVTTTRTWRRPLEHARFEIRLPAGAVPGEFSYPFSPEQTPAGPIYVYEADDFWPEHDITVSWSMP